MREGCLKAKKIFEKACEVIPGGVNSPVRAFIGLNVDPLIVQEGSGARIIDVDGKEYIDFCLSWGALLHGHAHPAIVERAVERIKLGSSFGIATEKEEELARKIVKGIPSIDQVRFVSSGTEATMSAVRLARGATSKSVIIKFNGNYHGHSDGFLVQAGSGVSQISSDSSSAGVPNETIKNTISLPFNDVEIFRNVMHDPVYSSLIAAVIVEPIAANMGVVPATRRFIEVLREETQHIGALLIFDEVVTGFRLGFQGAQGDYGVQPDLTCLGKIIGGGFPAAAFGGKREVMKWLAPEGPVFQAGTLSGNPVAMAAGLMTLTLAEEKGFYEELQRKTELVTGPIKRALVTKGLSACIQETIGMFTLFWGPRKVTNFRDLKGLDKKRFNMYFRFLLEHGVYLSPSPYEASFISSVHTDTDLEKMRELTLEFIEQC